MITASVRKLGPSGGRVLVQVVSVAGFTVVVAVIYLVVVLGIGAVPRNFADREIPGLSMLAAAAAAAGYLPARDWLVSYAMRPVYGAAPASTQHRYKAAMASCTWLTGSAPSEAVFGGSPGLGKEPGSADPSRCCDRPAALFSHRRRSRSAPNRSLCTYSAAPLDTAADGRSLTSGVEHKMTTTSGCADTIRRVASMPLISGMLMSISTRAG